MVVHFVTHISKTFLEVFFGSEFFPEQFCLTGEVHPGEMHPEGPFGDHYGYYSLRHDYPVFHVEHLCRRRDALFPATVVGKPRQEDFFIGDLLQELLAPLFPLVMPSVVDLWSYGETGYHSLAAAVVKERYRREAMVSAFRILGEGQLSLQKCLILTDQPVRLQEINRRKSKSPIQNGPRGHSLKRLRIAPRLLLP